MSKVFNRMRRGEMPTVRQFACPYCGGLAHAEASGWPDRLCIELWCDRCCSSMAVNGQEPWPGCESLLPTER